MSYTKTIEKMIDEGNDIFQVAKLFGGINKLLGIAKSSPYLVTLINSKLGGVLYCSAADEDEVMIPFELPFIITELQVLDEEMPDHYDATVNVIIPELTESREKQILLSWLFDYLTDMGSEVGSFNDSKLNMKQIWIHVDQINGQIFQLLGGGVSDEEVLKVIPDNYIRD